MGRPLLIGANERAEIARVLKYAETHRFSPADLIRIVNGAAPPSGDNAEHTCHIPIGYRVVYSEEFHKKKLMRYLSISLLDSNQLPHPIAAYEIAREFGFSDEIQKAFYVEDKVGAVNLLQERKEDE